MRIPMLFLFMWNITILTSVLAFTTTSTSSFAIGHRLTTMMRTSNTLKLSEEAAAGGQEDVIARRIIVQGAVQGGYYRACVLNEAGRFRRLVGTMTPPNDTDTAEIYVEGKRNLVDGFIRWCQRGKVGLNQNVNVKDVMEEDPTGLYDDFYVKTH